MACDRLEQYADAVTGWDRVIELSPAAEQPGLAPGAPIPVSVPEEEEAIEEVAELTKSTPGTPGSGTASPASTPWRVVRVRMSSRLMRTGRWSFCRLPWQPVIRIPHTSPRTPTSIRCASERTFSNCSSRCRRKASRAVKRAEAFDANNGETHGNCSDGRSGSPHLSLGSGQRDDFLIRTRRIRSRGTLFQGRFYSERFGRIMGVVQLGAFPWGE